MKQYMPADWQRHLQQQWEQPYMVKLSDFLEQAYANKTVFPPKQLLFSAFKATPFDEVKVVILGQDPYHGLGQANGMSFSVHDGVKFPPSLRNMLKELQSDLHIDVPLSGDLTKWAKQGVLLLNTVLTVEEGQAGSHQKKGWEQFTDAVLQALLEKQQPIVFVLWGKQAQAKEQLILQYPQHRIIKGVHPSPLSASRGFFGSKPYSKVNEYLQENGLDPIDWDLNTPL